MGRINVFIAALCLMLGSFFCSISGHSQVTDSITQPRQNYFRRSGTDITYMGRIILETYKRPFHWKKKEWFIFGAVIGGAALATTLDEPLYDFLQDKESGFMDGLSNFGDIMGKPFVNYPIMISFWGIGQAINDPWMRDTGIMMIGSVTTSGLLQTFAKGLIGRARPNIGEGPYSFNPFEGNGYGSLPSGHTTLAFALNWVLARQIKWLPGKILFYTIPIIVGISRIYDNQHWLSDVILGAALGIAGAETALHVYPRLKAKNQALTIGATNSGLGMVYKF